VTLIIIIIIIIIIAPLTIVSEDEWREVECLYKACQATRTDEGLFTDNGVDERGENERQSEIDNEMPLRSGNHICVTWTYIAAVRQTMICNITANNLYE